MPSDTACGRRRGGTTVVVMGPFAPCLASDRVVGRTGRDHRGRRGVERAVARGEVADRRLLQRVAGQVGARHVREVAVARIDGRPVMVIGQEKGRSVKDKVMRNFGMPKPEGYRKALRLMKLAERFRLPVLTFIDTPGAYPGVDAEERGQSEAIARNLLEMAGLRTPILATVVGEGGSGGALAVWYLKKNGYKILEQNYRTKLGEIDIIAKEKKTLVFVEVKTRKSVRYGNPKWAVTPKKQRNISMVALTYLKATKQSDARARFDVVAITSNQDEPQIEIVKNAFELAYK